MLCKANFYANMLYIAGSNTGLSDSIGGSSGGEIGHVPVLSTILHVHFRNSREGKSTSGVGNPCAPHPLNISLYKSYGTADLC